MTNGRELSALNVVNSLSFRFYEQLRVVDDLNDSGSRELRSLDAMNS